MLYAQALSISVALCALCGSVIALGFIGVPEVARVDDIPMLRAGSSDA